MEFIEAYYRIVKRPCVELVFNDKAELWQFPAYYWRFETEASVQDKAAKARLDSKWNFRT